MVSTEYGEKERISFQLSFCKLFTLITVFLWFFFKDFFIQDINAGLKDEADIPEQLVSTLLFNFKSCL